MFRKLILAFFMLLHSSFAIAFTWDFVKSADFSDFRVTEVKIKADTAATFIDMGMLVALKKLGIPYEKKNVGGYTIRLSLNSYEAPRVVEAGEIHTANTDINAYSSLAPSIYSGSNVVVRGLVDVLVPEATVRTRAYNRKVYALTAPTLDLTLKVYDTKGEEVYFASRVFNGKLVRLPGKGHTNWNYFGLFGEQILDPSFSAQVAITEMLMPVAFKLRGNDFFVKRNPSQAYYMSWFLPGSGKMYSGYWFSGLWDMGIETALGVLAYNLFTTEQGSKTENIVAGVLVVGLELLNRWRSAVGSYNAAIRYNYKAFFEKSVSFDKLFSR